MADVKQAIDFVMRQEDAALSGIITDRKADRGGRTRFGIAERWHPELGEFFDFEMVEGRQVPTVANSDAQATAEKIYESDYATPLQVAAFESQAVATGLLSLAVVEGPSEATALLQKAIVAVTPIPKQPKTWDYVPAPPVLAVDGLVGEKTIALANAADAGKLRDTLVAFAESHFQHIVHVIPDQAPNLNGWMNRAKALLEIPTSNEVEKQEVQA